MKTLIIVTHPNIEKSAINKRWIQELEKSPELYEVHNLYQTYPDEKIDVQKEQELLMSYNQIIFQFPLYWFSAPPLLKKWLDEVLTYGWAYGSNSGYKLAGKKIALAISAGIAEEEYRETGRYKYDLTGLTRPFEITFEYVKADYKPLFAYYSMEIDTTEAWVEASVPLYLSFLQDF